MDRTTSLASSSASTKCVVIPLCSRASSAARIRCSVARRANSATASLLGLSPGSSPDALSVGGPLTLLSANLNEALMGQSNCHRTLADRSCAALDRPAADIRQRRTALAGSFRAEAVDEPAAIPQMHQPTS